MGNPDPDGIFSEPEDGDLVAFWDDAGYLNVDAPTPGERAAKAKKHPDPDYTGEDKRVSYIFGNMRERWDKELAEEAEIREAEKQGFREAVNDRAYEELIRLTARNLARAKLNGQGDSDAIAKLPTPETLEQMIAAQDDAPLYRFEGLALAGGNTLICGNNKAGKTERTLEIVRSLLTGEVLFGEFEVARPLDGDVLYLNYELDKGQFASWLERIGVPSGRIKYLNLRGHNRVPLTTEAGAEWLLSHCSGVEAIVLDPAARMIQAAGIEDEDRNDQIKPLCGRLDEIKEKGGIKDLYLPIHANRVAYPLRPRGADYWGSWMDSQITIEKTRDAKKKRDEWHLSAHGRDIDVPRSQLIRDDSTYLCRVDVPIHLEQDPSDPLKASVGERKGPGRPGRNREHTRTAVFDYLDMNPTHSQNKTYDAIGGTKALVREFHREWTALRDGEPKLRATDQTPRSKW